MDVRNNRISFLKRSYYPLQVNGIFSHLLCTCFYNVVVLYFECYERWFFIHTQNLKSMSSYVWFVRVLVFYLHAIVPLSLIVSCWEKFKGFLLIVAQVCPYLLCSMCLLDISTSKQRRTFCSVCFFLFPLYVFPFYSVLFSFLKTKTHFILNDLFTTYVYIVYCCLQILCFLSLFFLCCTSTENYILI